MRSQTVEVPGTPPPEPHGPVPSRKHLAWHAMEYYMFAHFGVNTFTGRGWGMGDEDPRIFNPEQLDTRQWARIARDAGMRMIVMTAKHHDGFCLWPSRYTEHSVRNSSWKDGEGDVVAEVADACREYGLGLGLYYSPWDRNHAEYGTPAYVEYMYNQLEELYSHYGELTEIWFDGANGGDGYYGGARETRTIDRESYYDFPKIWEIIRRLQPGASVFSDGGPDVRWVGNEEGWAPDPCWSQVHPEGVFPGVCDNVQQGHGDPTGTVWRPAEVDTMISTSGWFYEEDKDPKPLDRLLDTYYESVGMGCNLILNVPPDRRGLLTERDESALIALHRVLDRTFAEDLARHKPVEASNVRGGSPRFAAAHATDGDPDTYWATDDTVRRGDLIVDFGAPTAFNRIRLEECVRLGQRVASFTLAVQEEEGWRDVFNGHTIGVRRFIRIPTVTTTKVRLRITTALACPTICAFEAYLATTE